MIKKCLCFLLFVALSQAYVSRESEYQDSQDYDSRERGDQDSQSYESRERGDQNSKAYESRERGDQDSKAYKSRERGNQDSQAYESRERGDQDSQSYERREQGNQNTQAYESRRERGNQNTQVYENRERENQGSPVYENRERGNQDLPAPNLLRLTWVEDPSLAIKVEWTKVETPQGADPIQGFKLKVWDQSTGKTSYRYETVNGVQRLIEDYNTGNYSDNDHASNKPRDVIVHGAEKTCAKVEGIERGVTYQVRIQAYNRNGDGPLSQPMSIYVAPKEDNYNNNNKNVYTYA